MEEQSLRADDCAEKVINFYSKMVYRLAFAQVRNKNDADDIYQEVFLRYLKKNPRFESEEHRKAWFLRVTINCSKSFFASSWLKKIQPLNEEIPFEMRETQELHQELMKLTPKYRSVIHLFYYEELSIEEISQILKAKPSTIRTWLTRARYKLKDLIKEDYDV